jgi:hypothetical protein
MARGGAGGGGLELDAAEEKEGSGLARRPVGHMFPAGSALVSGEVTEPEVELAPEVKMRGPEPVRRWPGRAPRGGPSEGSGISPEWLLLEAKAGALETEPEEPEEELGVWWCLECGSGETGESLPGGSVSGLSLEERSTAAAKASESVSGIGGVGRFDIQVAALDLAALMQHGPARRRDGDGDLVKWGRGRKQGMMKASGREGGRAGVGVEWEG